jgi:uncharacterized protein
MSEHSPVDPEAPAGLEPAHIEPAELGVTALLGHSRLGPTGEVVLCESEVAFNETFGDWEDAGLFAASLHGFFQNGGRRVYVVNLGPNERPLEPGDFDRLTDLVDVELVAAPGKTAPTDHQLLLGHALRARTRLALLDGPEDLEPALATLRPPRGPNGAFYVPWLLVHDPRSRKLVNTPPSAFMAGLMARVAREQGVHKAPANEPLSGVAGVALGLTQAQQDILHPRCVNAIRTLPHLPGIRPWAAKTLADRDPFRSLAAFRVWAHVVRSFEQGTTWLVGAGSQPDTWARLEAAGRAFLSELHQTGALVGATPDEAFQLRCDAETNPPASRDRDIVIASIGLALVSPGRFYTFQMGLALGEGDAGDAS